MDKSRDEELLEQELETEGSLSDEIVKRWDPEKLLRMVARRAGRGERLDEATRARFEKQLGVDLSRVRIYTGEFAEEVTRAHSAEALTVGTTGMILMRGSPGRSLGTGAGQSLLAHELTHVAQAERGVHHARDVGAAPLATEEHEAEAEEAEAEEASGSRGPTPEPTETPAERAEQLERRIRQRVMEMFADDEWVRRVRNGSGSFRP